MSFPRLVSWFCHKVTRIPWSLLFIVTCTDVNPLRDERDGRDETPNTREFYLMAVTSQVQLKPSNILLTLENFFPLNQFDKLLYFYNTNNREANGFFLYYLIIIVIYNFQRKLHFQIEQHAVALINFTVFKLRLIYSKKKHTPKLHGFLTNIKKKVNYLKKKLFSRNLRRSSDIFR